MRGVNGCVDRVCHVMHLDRRPWGRVCSLQSQHGRTWRAATGSGCGAVRNTRGRWMSFPTNGSKYVLTYAPMRGDIRTHHDNETADMAATAQLDRLAEAAIAAFYSDCDVPASEQYEDDCAMLAQTADEIFDWVDRCEENGHDVTDFRAAVLDYVIARDGANGDPDVQGYIDTHITDDDERSNGPRR